MQDTTPTLVHPVLRELNLPLPLTADASWILARTTQPGANREKLRITLAGGGDLIIEVHGNGSSASRYVFDATGQLVSLYQPQTGAEPLFQTLRSHVLGKIRECCTSQIQFP